MVESNILFLLYVCHILLHMVIMAQPGKWHGIMLRKPWFSKVPTTAENETVAAILLRMLKSY